MSDRRASEESATTRVTPADEQSTRELTLELTRLMLGGNLEFARATVQTFQALAAALLTASAAGTVALSALPKFRSIPAWQAVIPTALFAGALLALIILNITRAPIQFAYPDLTQTLTAYDGALRRRRSEIVLPAALVALGIAAAIALVLTASGSNPPTVSQGQARAADESAATALVNAYALDLDRSVALTVGHRTAARLAPIIDGLRIAAANLRVALDRLKAVSPTPSSAEVQNGLVTLTQSQLVLAGEIARAATQASRKAETALNQEYAQVREAVDTMRGALVADLAACTREASKC